MSYSRWSDSCWYTYSSCDMVGGEETLAVDCRDLYPLSELIDDKDAVLEYYRNLRFDRNPSNYQGKDVAPTDRYTEAEIQELSEIIDEFIEDSK